MNKLIIIIDMLFLITVSNKNSISITYDMIVNINDGNRDHDPIQTLKRPTKNRDIRMRVNKGIPLF